MPGGPKERGAGVGGIGLAISRYSSHPEEAATLIRFLLKEQLRSMENGTVHGLTRQAVTYGLNPQEAGGLPSKVISRPSAVTGQFYEQVTRAYAASVHSVLAGEVSAPKAASKLESQLVELTGSRSGAPE